MKYSWNQDLTALIVMTLMSNERDTQKKIDNKAAKDYLRMVKNGIEMIVESSRNKN